jgi:hypothetical protein
LRFFGFSVGCSLWLCRPARFVGSLALTMWLSLESHCLSFSLRNECFVSCSKNMGSMTIIPVSKKMLHRMLRIIPKATSHRDEKVRPSRQAAAARCRSARSTAAVVQLGAWARKEARMTPRRKKQIVVGFAIVLSLLLSIGTSWFVFFGGGYHAELWLAGFDQQVWKENQMQGMQSPRRPMVKSLMRRLPRGLSRLEVEALIGKPDYEMMGWQAYKIGYPRWAAFCLDYDVFEVSYQADRLVRMRVRNT